MCSFEMHWINGERRPDDSQWIRRVHYVREVVAAVRMNAHNRGLLVPASVGLLGMPQLSSNPNDAGSTSLLLLPKYSTMIYAPAGGHTVS